MKKTVLVILLALALFAVGCQPMEIFKKPTVTPTAEPTATPTAEPTISPTPEKRQTVLFDAVLPLHTTEDVLTYDIADRYYEEKIEAIPLEACKLTSLPTPKARENYTFSHWSYDVEGEPVTTLKAGTLYAVWKRKDGFLPLNSESGFLAMREDGKYYLTQDITLTDCYGGTFKGTLDGNGHTITLAIEKDQETAAPVSENEGCILRLNLTGSVSGTGSAGALVGANSGAVLLCTSTATVNGSVNVGGLVAHNDGNLSFCKVKATVCGDNYCGGIVGRNSGGMLYACRSDCKVQVKKSITGQSVGGLSGALTYSNSNIYYRLSRAEYCMAKGEIALCDVAKNGAYGGLAGIGTSSLLTHCYVDVQVTANKNNDGSVYGIAQSLVATSVYGENFYCKREDCVFSADTTYTLGGTAKKFKDEDRREEEGYEPFADCGFVVGRFLSTALAE